MLSWCKSLQLSCRAPWQGRSGVNASHLSICFFFCHLYFCVDDTAETWKVLLVRQFLKRMVVICPCFFFLHFIFFNSDMFYCQFVVSLAVVKCVITVISNAKINSWLLLVRLLYNILFVAAVVLSFTYFCVFVGVSSYFKSKPISNV